MIEQLLQFIQNHWILCSLFVTTLALIILEEIKSKLTTLTKLSARDATLLLNRENATILDLRNQKLFANGHIIGAINIARADIEQNLNKLEPYKDKSLILADEQDTDTFPVGHKLQAQGFTKIYVLAGGLQSWKDAQLPLIKK